MGFAGALLMFQRAVSAQQTRNDRRGEQEELDS
jgi:hypothetical protein